MPTVIYTIAGTYIFLCTSFYFLQENVIFHPRKLSDGYNFDFAGTFDELYFDSTNGARIHALHFRLKQPKGIVIYFHGNADNLARWGKYAADFTRLNYEVLMPDYRSFGKSKGKIDGEESFHADARALYKYAKERFPESRIILYGRSMGTGVATKLASENNPGKLILETPYYSLKDLHKRYFYVLPSSLQRYTFRTDLWIRKVKCPVFLIHGTKDLVVPYKCSVQLAELSTDSAQHAGNKPKLMTIENGRHKNLSDFSEYHSFLSELLNN